MPLLFAFVFHDALAEIDSHLEPGEHVFAYLDDVYILAQPERIRLLFDLLRECLQRRSGIDLNDGKTRALEPSWNLSS